MKHFQRSEFVCPESGEEHMQESFLLKLDKARGISGVPYVITEGGGYRSPSYNAKIGGVEDSAHVWGLAADIAAASSERRFHIMRGLILVGFRRIGISFDGRYIHVDDDESKPQDVMWGYNP